MSGSPDRRTQRRRADDLKADLALHRRANTTVRRAAIGLLAVVAVVLAVAVVALAVSAANDRGALSRATRATAASNRALTASNRALAASNGALNASNSALAAVRQTQHNQAVGLVQGCERLNTKQAEDNRNQQADYFYDRIFLVLIRANPAKTVRQRAQTREFLAPLRAALRSKAWVPLVPDCTKVSLHYKAPSPIPFARRQPPRSALVVPKR